MASTASPTSTGHNGEAGEVKLQNGYGERREHMFDKMVTPSDVGKLNQLVVPKHFTLKYFPLAATGAVLRFEDARGGDGVAKAAWSFRFCHWGGSQSYVMTKGWSHFVRQKGLAAGDTVSFFRAGARFFVDCHRRRGTAAPAPVVPASTQPVAVQRLDRVTGSKEASREKGLNAGESLSFSGTGARFLNDCRSRGSAAPSAVRPVVPASTKAVEVQRLVTPSSKAGGRCLRLFGVDFELGAQTSRLD